MTTILPCKYHTKKCPICGGKAMRPITGLMTDEKWELSMQPHCPIMEEIDEGGSTIGYHVICHNDGEEEILDNE